MGLQIIIEKEQTLSHNYEAKETITKKNIMYEGYGYELGEILSDAFEIEINVGKNLFLNEKTLETLQRIIDSLFKEMKLVDGYHLKSFEYFCEDKRFNEI